jgi:hypothetical protein
MGSYFLVCVHASGVLGVLGGLSDLVFAFVCSILSLALLLSILS